MTDEMIQFGKTLAKTVIVMTATHLLMRKLDMWLDDKKNTE